jgi:alanyl-tRNA synthetase
MKSADIRKRFLAYFERNGHAIVPSSPLVPANDPTLLFTNAGMVQFKDVFLGHEKRPYVRAASSQRCVRAGGKHNDLENVGYTARHHTFFEMLGNFSFGDYFKREAIHYAWEFLTKDLGLSPARLWVTVYKDDEQAADIWLKEIKASPDRFSRLGESSNFWQMGDTGPCGPCSEIFYDHGPKIPGGPPGSPDEDGDRYVEIWNLVFMQYNRDAAGKLHPLPKPSVDTGMGLERISAVMQGVTSNYEIDLFQALIRAAMTATGARDAGNKSLNVIADHIRSCAFLVMDGVLPSNEGRGYVLRRIIRRAARHGSQLGATEPFFYQLARPLAEQMGEAYPELHASLSSIERVLKQEEERFAETLNHGLRILEEDIGRLKGKVIPGETVFRLYDTYGFPADLTNDIARERGLEIDMPGFEREMEAQRGRARAATTFKDLEMGAVDAQEATKFTGYERLSDEGIVVQITSGATLARVDRIGEREAGNVVLDRTPFYAESGGQVGDRGLLRVGRAVFRVEDTQKVGAVFVHKGHVESGEIGIGDKVIAEVDAALRRATMLNHSATHLLHKALRDVLGPHVQQKGSLVDDKRTRFDFSHFEPMTPEQIREVERRVNAQIRLNEDTQARVMDMDSAKRLGAMALFGEKYGDEVRVLNIGDSMELCGGTHVRRAGDIGLFKILSESGVASGVRRIEATTGDRALAWLDANTERLERIAGLVRASPEEAERRVEQMAARVRALEKEIEQFRAKLSATQGDAVLDAVKEIRGVKVLATRLEGVDAKGLRDALDRFKDKLGNAAIVLASVDGDRVALIAGVTKDLTARVKAGELVNVVASKVGGKGGGRPDMAQAGGNDPSHLDAALAAVPEWIAQQLG